MQRRKEAQKRNVVLKIKTHVILEKYKVRLISEKDNSKLTFDDVIVCLLDKAQQ